MHFTTEHLMEIGKKLCYTLLIYCDVDVPKSLKEIYQHKKKKSKKNKGSNTDATGDDYLIADEIKMYNRK